MNRSDKCRELIGSNRHLNYVTNHHFALGTFVYRDWWEEYLVDYMDHAVGSRYVSGNNSGGINCHCPHVLVHHYFSSVNSRNGNIAGPNQICTHHCARNHMVSKNIGEGFCISQKFCRRQVQSRQRCGERSLTWGKDCEWAVTLQRLN